jgi:hypothetical protein
MPNLPMHIYLCQQIAEELDWGYVHDHPGAAYLGSTTPDIRAMTKWDRARTHFSDLTVNEVGTGVRRMFELHPELAGSDNALTPNTRAFLLGYVSHLVADEVWITTMFRPHFGPDQRVTDSEIEAHIWDRALQLDMDNSVLSGNGSLDDHNAAIAAVDEMPALEFLQDELIDEWKGWVARLLGWDFTWERLKRALNRMYRDNDEVQLVVDGFLADMPNSLERVYQRIPRELIDAYRQRVVEETKVQAREYLSAT